jgi:competence protein ComEA
MMKKMGDLLIGVLFGLLAAALILLVSRPKPGKAILLRPPPTPRPIVVNIDGGVQIPGVYYLPPYSRVFDVVESAGGFSENASPGSVNLAARLEDGDHIFIPILSSSPGEDEGNEVLSLSETGEIITLVNINLASREELETLPGIGSVTADKIIMYRQNQSFTRIEDIQKVPGIGPATFDTIKAYITIGE